MLKKEGIAPEGFSKECTKDAPPPTLTHKTNRPATTTGHNNPASIPTLDPPERCGGGGGGLPVAAAANTLATAVYAGFGLKSLSNRHASPSPGNVFGIQLYLSVNCH